MSEKHYMCPVCKKRNLVYVDNEVFCSNCKTYNKKLNLWNRYVQWTYTSNGWYRVPAWIILSFIGLSFLFEMGHAIDTVLSFDMPVLGPISALFSTLSLGIHEMGHFMFMPFGAVTLTRAMGSIMEIIFPVLLVLGLLQVRYYFLGVMSLIFVGFGFLSWSIYVADAVPQILSLVSAGGYIDDPSQIHDWYQILSQYDILQKYDEFARLLQFIGSSFILAGIVLSAFMIYKMIRNHPFEEEVIETTPNETPSPQSHKLVQSKQTYPESQDQGREG